MKEDYTIKEITEKTSTDFEQVNSELKRKYLIWNIETFNMVVSKVGVNRGSFGTGYPFYALNQDLKGTIPIIEEQIRYNRILVRDGIRIQKSIWKCESWKWNKFAKENNLFVTAGSDFHNKDGIRPEIGFKNTNFILNDEVIDEIISNLTK